MKKLFTISDRFHGSGGVLFAWQPDGNFLATAGSNGLVHIFDRHGQQIDEIALEHTGPCLHLDWDVDGEILAILQEGNSQVPLWELATRQVTNVETNLKDPSFLKWSRTGPQLAIGTGKGNLLIYNKTTRKKERILGKHSRKITCGAWSNDNRLALGGMDNMLTLSKANGEMVEQAELKYDPVDIQFAQQKTDSRSRGKVEEHENTVSVNMGGRTIYLYNLDDPDNPVELAFQARYGSIVTYRWFGDGYMMIGFSEGYLVVISTHMKEIGEELFSGWFHKDQLDDIAFSPIMQRAATAGGSQIKVIDMTDWKEVKEEATLIDRAQGPIQRLAWTNDGQILTVSTQSGVLYNFLARMPTIHDSHNTRVAYLSSLREISIVDCVGDSRVTTLPVSIEPSFVALGPFHVAVGMNNRVWYYRCDGSSRELVNEREYLSTVDSVQLNHAFAAVLCEGRVHMHPLEAGASGTGEAMIFPDREGAGRVTTCVLTREFLIYGTDEGAIEFFYLADWMPLSSCQFSHECGISALFPNPGGTRLIFLDEANRGFLYNPVNSLLLPVPKLADGTRHIMWDSADWGVFVTCSAKEFNTYIHSPLTIHGPQIVQLGALDIRQNGDMIMEPRPTRIPHGHSPIVVYNGVVSCQMQNGSLAAVTLKTHDQLHKTGRMSSERLQASFAQNLALLRLKEAWEVGFAVKSGPLWLALSGKAMEQLNIDMALRVYRELGDAGMVMALQKIRDVEDKNLLAGHVALLFAEYSQAQELFLTSSRPVTALEMRRDLLHWEHALRLAERAAPEQVPELSVEYAKQLEFRGEYAKALARYEEASRGLDAAAAAAGGAGGGPTREGGRSHAELRKACTAGMTRMAFRNGDLRRGLALANESGDKALAAECAAILEGMKQYAEAAKLYSKAGLYDQAAHILIMTKNFAAVAPLMDKIKTPKLHAQYAKAREVAKDYVEAARAYERARDMDSVVRLLLEHLKQPQAASEIVRRTQSAQGAQYVARYCQSAGDYRGAIEFLLMAQRSEDAFDLAKQHAEMATYAKALGEAGSQEEYMKIAKYFEGKSDWGKAGEFFAICGQYHKALKLFLQCGEAEMDQAIAVVGKAKNDMLTHTLIDFLMGETDGVPKDPNYIFRLYMALGNYLQAGKTAIIISRQEQELGNYKVAHNILFETHKDLEVQHIRVPQALSRSLLLLHSYNIVKKLVKLGNHTAAARMLVRVAKNISKFPSHVVPILTSTVIECQRAGLKNSAFEYASTLMRPEYRSQIEPKFKRKIEALVRRPNRNEKEEAMSPCPFCQEMLPITELDCTQCKNSIPYCIITGGHMTLEDWSSCPSCRFPALHSEFQTYLGKFNTCPMCDQEIILQAVRKADDPRAALQAALGNAGGDDKDQAANADNAATAGAAGAAAGGMGSGGGGGGGGGARAGAGGAGAGGGGGAW